MKHIALATYIYFRAQIVAVVPNSSDAECHLFSPDYKLEADDELIVVASDIAVSEEVLTLTRKAVILACTGGDNQVKRKGSFFTRAGEFLRRASEAQTGSMVFDSKSASEVVPKKEHSR